MEEDPLLTPLALKQELGIDGLEDVIPPMSDLPFSVNSSDPHSLKTETVLTAASSEPSAVPTSLTSSTNLNRRTRVRTKKYFCSLPPSFHLFSPVVHGYFLMVPP